MMHFINATDYGLLSFRKRRPSDAFDGDFEIARNFSTARIYHPPEVIETSIDNVLMPPTDVYRYNVQ